MKSIGGDKVYINYLEAREKYEINKYGEINTAKEACIKEGLEKGKLKEQKQIALNMKNQRLDDEFIAKCLNISIDELQKLLLDNTDS